MNFEEAIQNYVRERSPLAADEAILGIFIHNVYFSPARMKHFCANVLKTSFMKRRFHTFMREVHHVPHSEAQYYILKYMREHHPEIEPARAEQAFFDHIYTTERMDEIEREWHQRVRLKVARRMRERGTETVMSVVRRFRGDEHAVQTYFAAMRREVNGHTLRRAHVDYQREREQITFTLPRFMQIWNECNLLMGAPERARVANACGLRRREVQQKMRTVMATLTEIEKAGWDEHQATEHLGARPDVVCALWIQRKKRAITNG